MRLGIIGLGTVGAGVVKIIQNQPELIAARAQDAISITAISARTRNKERPVSIDAYRWEDNPMNIATADDVDMVVELVGGEDGMALEVCRTALESGKHVVTANKALIARHGTMLAELAKKNNVSLAFEAAVAGGIPIIKSLKEGLAANHIYRVFGIMNGTCNYILSVMEATGRRFEDVLSEAQQLGYAEAEPSFDVDGIDTAHKLSILSALAFAMPVAFDEVYIEGIRHITPLDIAYAKELGYRIKLLGLCARNEHITQVVRPTLVPLSHSIANVNGVDNAVAVEASDVGHMMCQGPGAGMGATASAVMADVIDITSGRSSEPFGVEVAALESKPIQAISESQSEYYLRIPVEDKPGVLAKITDALSAEGASAEAVLQKPADQNGNVNVVIATHEVKEAIISKVIENLETLSFVTDKPICIKIL